MDLDTIKQIKELRDSLREKLKNVDKTQFSGITQLRRICFAAFAMLRKKLAVFCVLKSSF
jgi:hypothetical protein